MFDPRLCLVTCGPDYIANLNENPKRFVWKADGTKILEKINRARNAIGMTALPEALAQAFCRQSAFSIGSRSNE